MTAIALVCDYSLRYLGGAQAAFLDQARILVERGHDVVIVAPDASAHDSPADTLDIPARVSLPGLDLPVIRNTPELRRRLREEFRARGVEVVHVHSEFGLTAAAIDVAGELRLPTAHTVHTFFWQAPMNRAAARLAAAAARGYARWVRGVAASDTALAPQPLDSALRAITLSTAERVGVVISPSSHQAEKLRDAGLTTVQVIENAVPDAGGSRAPAALEGIDGALRVVWVGRLVPEKRILEFIAAVKQAARRLGSERLEVEIIGDGPLQAQAQRLANDDPSIRFLGRLERDDVRDRMRGAHLVALTSYGFDNQPVVVVEAFSEARSVLYVDPALTEGLAAGGVLAPGPDAHSMAETLVALADDPDRVVAASHRAVRAAAAFDPERHAALVIEAYRTAGLP